MRAKILSKTVKALEPADKPYEIRDTEIPGFLLRVQPSGAMTYYLEYRSPSGKKQRFRFGTRSAMTPTAARETAQGLYKEVAKGTDLQKAKKDARAAEAKAKFETLGGFIVHRYAAWATTHQKRGNETLQLLQSNFGHLYDTRLDKLTTWDVQRWRTERGKKGLSAASINRRVGMLKSVLNRAVEAGVIVSNPLSGVRRLRVDDNARIRFLSKPEEAALRDALDEREVIMRSRRRSANEWRLARRQAVMLALAGPFADYLKPMVLVALNTGMRRGELFDLDWGDVDFDRQLVTVSGAHSKTGQTRHINLNSEACEILKKWSGQSHDDLVFTNPVTGRRFDNVKSSWNRLRLMAGLDDFRFHDLRHTFASKLVMAGVDLYTVKELMGHSTIQMTERYAHLAPEHRASAVERIVRQEGEAHDAKAMPTV